MTHRVLVTGGLGYLGGRVAKALARRSDTAVVLTSRDPAGAPAVPFVVERIARLDLVEGPPPGLLDGVTSVIHLAAANEVVSGARPDLAIDATTRGTAQLLSAAVEAGVARFVYLSTAHIYASPLEGTITEDTVPRPGHPYAITHRAAEDFVLAAADRGSLSGVVVRLSNAFGAPIWPEVDRWTLLVNDLCRQAVEHGRLTLRSAGLQERDFICMSDAVRGILHLLELTPAVLGEGIFNLGGRCSMRVLDMARLIQARAESLFGARPELVVGAPPASGPEPRPLRYDCARLAATGFEWRGDAEQEIDETLRLCHRAFSGEAQR